MSKSIGNVILVKDLINQYDGEVIRLAPYQVIIVKALT